jgi:hypothetical protein
VPAKFTQDELRRAFQRWGLPQGIRVDNGWPWGSAGDLPTGLALWLIGLGLKVLWNPPRRPQKNGVVERSQGTGKRWADPASCEDIEALRRRLQEQDAIQREFYPSIGGKSRMEAFPGLRHSGRPYRPETEAARWDVHLAWDHLSEYVLTRRVDHGGTISVYNRNRYVGKTLRGQVVYVRLDPLTTEWMCSDSVGRCHTRQKAEELSSDRIPSLDVTYHRDRLKPPRRTRQKSSPPLPGQPSRA